MIERAGPTVSQELQAVRPRTRRVCPWSLGPSARSDGLPTGDGDLPSRRWQSDSSPGSQAARSFLRAPPPPLPLLALAKSIRNSWRVEGDRLRLPSPADAGVQRPGEPALHAKQCSIRLFNLLTTPLEWVGLSVVVFLLREVGLF